MHPALAQMGRVRSRVDGEICEEPTHIAPDGLVARREPTLHRVSDDVREEVHVVQAQNGSLEQRLVALGAREKGRGRKVEEMRAEQPMVQIEAERPVLVFERGSVVGGARRREAERAKRLLGGDEVVRGNEQIDVDQVSKPSKLGPSRQQESAFQRRRHDPRAPENHDRVIGQSSCEVCDQLRAPIAL